MMIGLRTGSETGFFAISAAGDDFMEGLDAVFGCAGFFGAGFSLAVFAGVARFDRPKR